MKKRLSETGNQYDKGVLLENQVERNPFTQFDLWLKEAERSGIVEPNAMAISTVSSDGKPSSRMVLLKGIEKEGFVFFTNYTSRKGLEMMFQPHVALLFFWDKLERQVRIEGKVSKIKGKESDEYFLSRPYGSQVSAIISPQSQVIPGRDCLESRFETFKSSGIKPQRPIFWGGYLVKPVMFEFWQGRKNRLHDRFRYTKTGKGWKIERLAP